MTQTLEKAGMIFRRELILILLFWMSVSSTYGQDLHFTQFYNNPLLLNPSMTGNFTGTLRAGTTYRNQWRSISPNPFNTFAVFSDYKWFRESGDVYSAGIFFAHDNSGPGDLIANKIFLSGAYHKFKGDNSFSAGIQFGFVSKTFSTTTWPVQYIPFLGIFDPGSPNLESSYTARSGYPDLNAGFSWTRTGGNSLANLGFAIFHFNSPNESMFRDHEITLNPRMSIHGHYRYLLTEKFSLEPSFLLMNQNKANELIIGFYNIFRISQKMEVKAGPFYRNNIKGYHTKNFPKNVDALTANVVIGYEKFKVGISYDINISELTEASNYKGGFEFTLIYTDPFEPITNIRKIPCFRY